MKPSSINNTTLSPSRVKNNSFTKQGNNVKTCMNTQNNTPFSNGRKISSKLTNDSGYGKSMVKLESSYKKPKFLEKFNKEVVIKKNSN